MAVIEDSEKSISAPFAKELSGNSGDRDFWNWRSGFKKTPSKGRSCILQLRKEFLITWRQRNWLSKEELVSGMVASAHTSWSSIF